MSKRAWPSEIFLQSEDGEYSSDTSWCQDRINDDDVRYVLPESSEALRKMASVVVESYTDHCLRNGLEEPGCLGVLRKALAAPTGEPATLEEAGFAPETPVDLERLERSEKAAAAGKGRPFHEAMDDLRGRSGVASPREAVAWRCRDRLGRIAGWSHPVDRYSNVEGLDQRYWEVQALGVLPSGEAGAVTDEMIDAAAEKISCTQLGYPDGREVPLDDEIEGIVEGIPEGLKAAFALSAAPSADEHHLPWADECSKCGGLTFVSPDVVRAIRKEKDFAAAPSVEAPNPNAERSVTDAIPGEKLAFDVSAPVTSSPTTRLSEMEAPSEVSPGDAKPFGWCYERAKGTWVWTRDPKQADRWQSLGRPTQLLYAAPPGEGDAAEEDRLVNCLDDALDVFDHRLTGGDDKFKRLPAYAAARLAFKRAAFGLRATPLEEETDTE